MKVVWSAEKLQILRSMLIAGKSYSTCGKHFGVSVTRIGQVVKAYLPTIGPIGKRAEMLARASSRKKSDIEKIRFDGEPALKKAFLKSFRKKKYDSKREGSKWDFTISIEDVEFVTHCPVLGVKLDWFASKRCENSPSYDRIDPKLGYVRGNVAIISMRANRIKNDGSAEDHRKIYQWMTAMGENPAKVLDNTPLVC